MSAMAIIVMLPRLICKTVHIFQNSVVYFYFNLFYFAEVDFSLEALQIREPNSTTYMLVLGSVTLEHSEGRNPGSLHFFL